MPSLNYRSPTGSETGELLKQAKEGFLEEAGNWTQSQGAKRTSH